MNFPQEHKRLMELVGLVRDEGLDPSQAAELEVILENDPEALAYYVESIDLTSILYRQQGVVSERPSESVPLPVTPLSVVPAHRAGWSATWTAAICASLAFGAAVGMLWQASNVTTRPGNAVAAQNNRVDNEIATLSFATGCRWDMAEQSRYEGQRLKSESLRLESGIAVIQFDSDVRLVLEGPAQLDLTGVDRAVLRYGNVVFSGEGDMDSFALETPFSKILDQGTEYAVSVDRAGKVGEVHVFDGRVICEPPVHSTRQSTKQPIQIGAGDARRFSGLSSIEAIELAANRFVRQPATLSESADATIAVESFAYDSEILADQNGGVGWQQAWIQRSRFPTNSGVKLRSGESLAWRNKTDDPDDGSLMISGDSGLGRTLRDPIRMDCDAAYYLSFLVKKHSVPEGMDSNGWAYVTLRNSQVKAGHVSIGPITQPGAPRIVHDGRVENATNSLREGVVYLFVCKILAGRDSDDQVQVRIYADHEVVDSVEPSMWNVTTRPINSDSILDELRVFAKNSPPIQFDEIRIGRTWSSVASAYFE